MYQANWITFGNEIKCDKYKRPHYLFITKNRRELETASCRKYQNKSQKYLVSMENSSYIIYIRRQE